MTTGAVPQEPRHSTVECLGSCGTAPVVMVNEAYHENVDVEALDAFLGKLA